MLAGCSDAPKPAAPSIQVIDFGLSPDRPPLRSSQDVWETSGVTGVAVYPGDRIEIRPQKLIRQERSVAAPVTTRTSVKVCVAHAQVCTATVPTFETQCHQKCKVCESCNLFGCVFKTCCTPDCQSVHTGDQCTTWEDRCSSEQTQWQDECVYPGLGDFLPKDDALPLHSESLLTQGIHLKLDSMDSVANAAETDCAVSQFGPVVVGDAVVFTINNVAGCPHLFPEGGPNGGQNLILLNQMVTSAQYHKGRQVTAQDGRIVEQPETRSYDVALDFVGTVSIVRGSQAGCAR
jgi:hypothetical protein